MAMNATLSGDNEPMSELNTTPLIDVMLVLLIMFIVTLPLLTHSTVIDMPRAAGAPASVVEVTIDFDDTILWNGTVVRDLAQFESFIRAENSASKPQLQVRPDRRARYDTVAKVLAIAQRNGVEAIAISGTLLPGA